jgi:hypothetical protein
MENLENLSDFFEIFLELGFDLVTGKTARP